MPLILIASQDPDTRLSIRDNLINAPYEVIEAESGESCLTTAQQILPDLILLDMLLPPVEGKQVGARLHTMNPYLPILMLVPGENSDAEAAFEAGATDIIASPFQPIILRSRITHLLEAYPYISIQERELWYHSVIENAIEGIYRCLPDGRFLLVNPALVKLLGYDSVEEVLKLDINRDVYVNPEQRKTVITLLETQPTYEFEALWKRKDGQHITVQVFVRAIRDGEKLYFEGEVLDITEKKMATAALHKSQHELQAKTESLETINMIADEVYHSLDMETVLTGALKAVMNYLHVPGASIYLVDESRDSLVRVATRGVTEKLSASAGVLPLRNSLNAQAVSRRDIVISDNPREDERIQPVIREALSAANIRQIIALPLLYQEQVIGTLSMPLTEPRRLTFQERATLLSVGKTIGLGIANARYVMQVEAESQERLRAEMAEHEQRVLAEALRETASVLNSALDQDEVLERILTNVRRVVPSDTANVFMIQKDGVAYSVRSVGYAEHREGLEDEALQIKVSDTPNLRWMAETGLPRAIPDTLANPDWVHLPGSAWIRSAVSAPIVSERQVIGFLNLDSAIPNTFTDEDAAILKIFADQAGIAIRNAQLYDSIRRHADTLELHVAERASELALERAKLRALLDGMADGVIGVIYDEPITLENFTKLRPSYRYINQSLFNMLGYSNIDWTNAQQLGRQVVTDDFEVGWMDYTSHLLEHGRWHIETHFARADGTTLEVSVRASAVRRGDGELIGAITIVRDISNEKKLERQRTRFISNAAHELRTPITNLKTRLYLARKQPERMATHLQILEQVTDHMKDLAEYLLDLSRIEHGILQLRRENIDLDRFVSEVVNLQRPEAEKGGVNLTMDLAPYPLKVYADFGRMNQVLTNLLSNAIRHTPSGGSITIRVVRGDDEYAGRATLEVRDTGTGIKPEHLHNIFEPFYQASQNATGVGLGLSISKEIVEMHGGTISVTSELGKGTCFRVELPLVE